MSSPNAGRLGRLIDLFGPQRPNHRRRCKIIPWNLFALKYEREFSVGAANELV
jgi:hypothetical protein